METESKGSDAVRGQILKVLASGLRQCVEQICVDFGQVQEIRLRAGSPLMLVYQGIEYFAAKDGTLHRTSCVYYIVSQRQIRETMELISNYSLYAFEEELRQGFITIQGGHRVGVAGKIVLERENIKSMRYISYINIRLAHQVTGCADGILPYILQKGSIFHTLIISPPRCGKTTLLRDTIRQLSNGDAKRQGMNIGVVDERSELGACYQGKPQNDLGIRTDILDCCPKKEGMMMLVRSMSPQVIAVDEIGSREDMEALEYVMNCGVQVIATVHGQNMEEVRNKPVLGQLVREKIFQRYILLESGNVGRVAAIFDERGSCLL